jgi:hypothetical protein
VAQLAIEERHFDKRRREPVLGRFREESRHSAPRGHHAFARHDQLETFKGITDRVDDLFHVRVPVEGYRLGCNFPESDSTILDPQKEPRTLFMELLTREYGSFERDALSK